MELDFKNLRVMIIDDQSTMRSIVRQLLNKTGIRKIKEAKDGFDAIHELKNNGTLEDKIDLIICDLYMDGMDGISFIREIRKGGILANKDIPILILTGSNDRLIEEVALQVGATKIIRKPISADTLGLEIQKIVANDTYINKVIDSHPAEYFGNNQVETYKKGDTIFSQDDEGIKAYIVMSGSVGLYRKTNDKTISFDVAEKNSIFGEMSFFENKHRLVTAIALEDTECSIISEDLMKSQFEKSPLFIQILLRVMAKKIKKLSSASTS
jgi:CheY-like chemotaxis protein